MKILLPFPIPFASGGNGKRRSTTLNIKAGYIIVKPMPQGISLSLYERSVHIDVPAFLLPKRRLQLNDRLDGI
jgi:hypothetical protein